MLRGDKRERPDGGNKRTGLMEEGRRDRGQQHGDIKTKERGQMEKEEMREKREGRELGKKWGGQR